MNLVLVGYRGTGKSTIGRLVAAELGLPLVSSDEEIVARAGMGIPEIVAVHGWDHFRDMESLVVAELTARDAQVLDMGGGVVVREENCARLRCAGLVVRLEASVADIAARIGGGGERPSLTGRGNAAAEVAEVLRAREDAYRKVADHTVNTSALSPAEAASRIVGLYRRALAARA